MTPEDIERLLQSKAHSQDQNKDDEEQEEDGPLSDQERSFRVDQLKPVLLAAQDAWASGSEDLDLIADKLATGSRDASWRVPVGDSGLLDVFLGILPVDGLRQPLLIHTLRLIGNSSADTDENRAKVVESKQIPSLVKLFSNDSLLPFLIPVMYNVCVDYEPAQLEACKACLSSVLVDIISGPSLQACQPLLNIVCKILKLLISQEPEIELASPATPTCLLSLAVSRTHPPDLEDFCGLASAALAYLTNEQFQTHLLNSGSCELLMQCFEDSNSRFDIASADPEEAAELEQIGSAFVQIFADISASPYFFTVPLGRVERLVGWLRSPMSSHPYLQTAACLSLGNLARSDEASTALLSHVYEPISALLKLMAPSASQLQHALLSFLKNLAIPAPNKPILGQLLLEPANDPILSRFWSTETQPQTQFATISLTRLLVSGCPANVSRLCAPTPSPTPSPNPNPNPASSQPAPHEGTTNLHLLMSATSRADAEPTKFEGARTVAAVCKALHGPPPPTQGGQSSSSSSSSPLQSWGGGADARQRFYAAHEASISACLARLVAQRRFAALRSEGLLAMALMSRSVDGAGVVCRALCASREAFDALAEAVTGTGTTDTAAAAAAEEGGEEGPARQVGGGGGGELDAVMGLGLEPRQASISVDPAQAASMGRIDRENGLVLVAELLRQDASVLPQPRRSELEEMLKAGGEMVISQRQREGTAG